MLGKGHCAGFSPQLAVISLSGAPRTRTWNRRFWRPITFALAFGECVALTSRPRTDNDPGGHDLNSAAGPRGGCRTNPRRPRWVRSKSGSGKLRLIRRTPRAARDTPPLTPLSKPPPRLRSAFPSRLCATAPAQSSARGSRPSPPGGTPTGCRSSRGPRRATTHGSRVGSGGSAWVTARTSAPAGSRRTPPSRRRTRATGRAAGRPPLGRRGS